MLFCIFVSARKARNGLALLRWNLSERVPGLNETRSANSARQGGRPCCTGKRLLKHNHQARSRHLAKATTRHVPSGWRSSSIGGWLPSGDGIKKVDCDALVPFESVLIG